MSDRYSFTSDRTFVDNGTMVWNDQVAVQTSLDFSHVSDSTLTDSINDSYATAVGDNETQYLSVLETTNDITLDDLHNITLENSKMTPQDNLQFENINPVETLETTNTEETNDQQVIVFSVDGSDDLYGIQIAQDEEGNTQRYQFKFRTTEDGQLEAIPESIELLANDLEPQQNETENEILTQQTFDSEETEAAETQVIYEDETDVQEAPVFEEVQEDVNEVNIMTEEHDSVVQMFIKGEPQTEVEHAHAQMYIEGAMGVEEVGEEEQPYEDTEVYLDKEFDEEENLDVKTGILEEHATTSNIKQEMFQEENQDVDDTETLEEEYHMYNEQQIDIKPLPYHGENVEEEIESAEDVEHHLQDNFEADNAYMQVDEAVQETVLEYEHYPPEDVQHVYGVQHEGADAVDEHHLPLHVSRGSQFNRVFVKHGASFRRLSEGKRMAAQLSDEVEEEEEEEQETYYAETATENDSDNDDYQIVEGLHVTAEGDDDHEDASSPSFHEPDTILQEVIKRPATLALERANILKQPSLIKTFSKEPKTKNNNKTLVYYVVPHVEKENVNSLPVNYTTAVGTGTFRTIRTNPRSILKSSFTEIKEESEPTRTGLDERFNKRFARSKEAVQARLFNNFISKTTIPHAPIRQTRLPRKQQIKPVDNRRDEEIIVQEVMVGSNGFIENVEDKLRNKEKLEVTQYVILSDSDEDYDPKKGTKKKKKHKRHTKNGMDESEHSDVSVIEIPSDDEDTSQQENTKRGRGRPKKSVEASSSSSDSTKRRRGRPPKSGQTNSDGEGESPQKKCRTESVENETTKKEFNCPHCTKTFPSSNSLSTHIHHHSLENSLRNNQTMRTRNATAAVPVEYKHKCETCLETFKNSILLKRHVCSKQTQKTTTCKRVECTVCKKSFPDLVTLKVHARSHIKENLVNATTVTKVSPKKVTLRPSTVTSRLRSPSKRTSTVPSSKSTTFKCKDCSRVCFSQESLNLHQRTHRKFPCASCGSTFPSRLLLDTHVRVSCVKGSPQPNNKRLSFKIRKSYMYSPSRKSIATRRSLAVPQGGSKGKATPKNTLNLNLECDKCGQKFAMFQEYFKHQVKMHGLETPDKSILKEQTKRLHKPKALHGGIPAREGMRKVFAEIKSKMALITPKKDTH